MTCPPTDGIDRLAWETIPSLPPMQFCALARATGNVAHFDPSRPTPLFLRTLTAGAEHHRREHQTLLLDPDSYLLMKNPTEGLPSGPSARAVAFCVSLGNIGQRPGLPDPPRFHASLRLKTPCIESMLQTLVEADGRAAGEAETRECRERLLQAIVRNELEFNARAGQLDCVKPATRHELLRRVLLASDFILTHFEAPIQLQDIADAARVSMFHLVRPFGQIFGMPPHAYLMHKRLLVARRLLHTAQYDMHEIAQRSGFGNRWSLFRQMQKHQIATGACGAPLRKASRHPNLGL